MNRCENGSRDDAAAGDDDVEDDPALFRMILPASALVILARIPVAEADPCDGAGCSGAKKTSRQQVHSFSYAEALLVNVNGAAHLGVATTVCD